MKSNIYIVLFVSWITILTEVIRNISFNNEIRGNDIFLSINVTLIMFYEIINLKHTTYEI
jgi:hypothetical protein